MRDRLRDALHFVPDAQEGASLQRKADRSWEITETPTPNQSPLAPEPEDEEACAIELGDRGEFIFDIHTHHVMPEGVWRDNADRMAETSVLAP